MAEILSERLTDQLRCVTRKAYVRLADPGPPPYHEWVDVVVGVQRLWYVQTEPLYTQLDGGPPNSPNDVFTHCDSDGRAWWAPMTEQWRPLESAQDPSIP